MMRRSMVGKQAILIQLMPEAIYLSTQQGKKIDVKSYSSSTQPACKSRYKILMLYAVIQHRSQKGIHSYVSIGKFACCIYNGN